jgi:hypothetical protein
MLFSVLVCNCACTNAHFITASCISVCIFGRDFGWFSSENAAGYNSINNLNLIFLQILPINQGWHFPTFFYDFGVIYFLFYELRARKCSHVVAISRRCSVPPAPFKNKVYFFFRRSDSWFPIFKKSEIGHIPTINIGFCSWKNQMSAIVFNAHALTLNCEPEWIIYSNI